MMYFFYFIAALAVSAAITPLVKRFAFWVGAIDVPRPPRNLHKNTTAKLGGLAVYVAVAAVVILYLHSGAVDYHVVPLRFIMALLAGGAVLMLGGFLDDKYDLPPYIAWLFPALAALIVVWSGIGIGITFISNPFGGVINLKFHILSLPASGVFSWVWMMGMMFTTKFLDGLDGLVAGVGTIASFTLFFLSLAPQVNQPITATLAIILTGALTGYLFHAFYPAKIFFGDGGSLFVGFMLGLLSIILGGKIATALLVMGIPVLDVAWVIARRLWYRRSPFRGDRLHLHFRLLDLGFSQRQTVLILYLIAAAFGFTAIFLQSLGKLVSLVILFGVMVVLVVGVVMLYKRKYPHVPGKG